MPPKQRYKYIRFGLRARGLTYATLGNEIGYCEGYIKKSMSFLKNGKPASANFLDAVAEYFERTSKLKNRRKEHESEKADCAAECGGD